MRLEDLIRIWRRRAWLTAALITATLLGCGAGLAWLPATYQSQASVVLLASRSAAKLTGGNPYLSFTSSLSLTADVVSRALTGPAVTARLAGLGFTDSYTVAPPAYATTTTGSVLIITVTGHDAAGVQGTMQAVVAQIGAALRQLQGHLRPRNRITVTTLASSPAAAPMTSATIRPAAMMLILGMLAALGVPVILDGWLWRRRSTTSAAREPVIEEVGQLADGWRGAGTR